MTRPIKPAETFPFEGTIWNADGSAYLGEVTGLFYCGHDQSRRGEFHWRGQRRGTVEVADTVTLKRAGRANCGIVVMSATRRVGFRCCASGSPL